MRILLRQLVLKLENLLLCQVYNTVQPLKYCQVFIGKQTLQSYKQELTKLNYSYFIKNKFFKNLISTKNKNISQHINKYKFY